MCSMPELSTIPRQVMGSAGLSNSDCSWSAMRKVVRGLKLMLWCQVLETERQVCCSANPRPLVPETFNVRRAALIISGDRSNRCYFAAWVACQTAPSQGKVG